MIKTNKLQAKMIEHGYTIKDISKCLNITPTGYFNKLHNTSEFRASEIAILSNKLFMTQEETMDIFFDLESDCE